VEEFLLALIGAEGVGRVKKRILDNIPISADNEPSALLHLSQSLQELDEVHFALRGLDWNVDRDDYDLLVPHDKGGVHCLPVAREGEGGGERRRWEEGEGG
jgi:hypothetical protein